jgi:predicted dehydrogenase
LLDLITSLINTKVTKVIAAGNNISTKGSNFRHFDFVSSLLKFDNDIVCKVSSNFGSVTPHNHIFKVYGKKSSVHYSNQRSTYYKLGMTSNPKDINYNYKNSEKAKILKSFISTVYNKKESSIVRGSEVLNLMSVSLSIEKSLKTGRWEKVKYINY